MENSVPWSKLKRRRKSPPCLSPTRNPFFKKIIITEEGKKISIIIVRVNFLIKEIGKKKKKNDRVYLLSLSYLLFVYLQISKSNSHDVTLVDVSRKMTGMYKCEVMSGKPSYHAQIKKARMEVVGELVGIKNFPTEGRQILLLLLLILRC